MSTMEIVLLLIGIIVFAVSFLIPAGNEELSEETRKLAREEIGTLVAQEMERIRSQVDDTVEEAMEYSMEKTERSLERISNEKIMAVNEYSETVLEQINRSQQEMTFLYDMLNAKHDNLKNTATQVEQKVREAEEASREVEAVTREAQQTRKEAEAAAQAARQVVVPAFQALQAQKVSEDAVHVLEQAQPQQEETKEQEPQLQQPELTESESYSNNNEKILELHRQGRSDVAIARSLGLGVGEVKLVIDLFKGTNQ
ncbi:MAG: hypothetical protein J6B43_12840 [Lachnospiraceae bacterium]|nr:hypothetical protein [Lachnospiraceae bacterium]